MQKTINLPVKKVVFMEDRAQVKRVSTLALQTGRNQLLIEGISPFLLNKSLYFHPVYQLQCQNLMVQRTSLHKEEVYQAESQGIYLEREALEKELKQLEVELSLFNSARKDLVLLRSQFIKEIELEVSNGRSDRAFWQANMQSLNDQSEELKSQKLSLMCRQDLLSREIDSKNLKLQALKQQVHEKASILMDIDCAEAGDYEIQIEYLLPGACWRPSYKVKLNTKTQHMKLISGASLWQNTGENWQDIQVSLSTQRGSLGTNIPELKQDYLYTRRKRPVLKVTYSEETVSEFNEIQKITQMPGIDDGGDVITLNCPGKMTLNSDAYPVKVDLNHIELEVELRNLAYPELLESVILQSLAVNNSSQRLLAGPVELIKDGGVIGKSTLDVIAPGQKFSLDWGADEYLVLKRKTKSSQTDKLLSTWRVDNNEVDNYLSNLSSEEKTLTLIERVPVSDIEQVKIEVDSKKTSGAKGPNKDGFVEWEITLSADDHQKVELHYATKKKNAVVE
jgi:uncharacterized protein (TIGR02231 family)